MLKRLLLAEGQAESFQQLKKILVKNNWSIASTSDGEEALSLLKENSYDVLITDLNLLTITGIDLISRVQLEVNPKPGIIRHHGHKNRSAWPGMGFGIDSPDQPSLKKTLL
jgi:DNA-binding response OmpR family regulator